MLKVLNHEQEVSQYDQDMEQSHTADQQEAPRGRDSEHQQLNDSKKTIKVKQPALSSSIG